MERHIGDDDKGPSSRSVSGTLPFFPLHSLQTTSLHSQGSMKDTCTSTEERDYQLFPIIAGQETKHLFSMKYEFLGLVGTNCTFFGAFHMVTRPKLSFNPCNKLYNNCRCTTSLKFATSFVSYLLVSLSSESYLLTIIHTLVYMNLKRTTTSITIHVALVTVCSNEWDQRNTRLQARCTHVLWLTDFHLLYFSIHVAGHACTLPLISCFL